MPLSVYTDGSAHDRGGWPGGWAFAVVRDGELLVECSGAERATTNNLVELLAALHGLNEVVARGWHCGARVELVSDSRVVLDVASGRSPSGKHRALAEAVRAAAVQAVAEVRWVRGHSGDGWNERVDALAGQARLSLVPARVRRRAERRALGAAGR